MRYHDGSRTTPTAIEGVHFDVLRFDSGRAYLAPGEPSLGVWKQYGAQRPGQLNFPKFSEPQAVSLLRRDQTRPGDETNPTNAALSSICSPQILLAEDDVLWREYSAVALRSAGFEVDSAADGNRAWEMFRKKRYDLIITDNDMPRMSGVELFARIRIVNDDIPVLLISSSSAALQIFVNAGFQNWKSLPKPFTADHLVDTVREVVSVGCSASFDI